MIFAHLSSCEWLDRPTPTILLFVIDFVRTFITKKACYTSEFDNDNLQSYGLYTGNKMESLEQDSDVTSLYRGTFIHFIDSIKKNITNRLCKAINILSCCNSAWLLIWFTMQFNWVFMPCAHDTILRLIVEKLLLTDWFYDNDCRLIMPPSGNEI